ncbi:cold-regulated protein 27-like isoform X1 [Primulina tabacum]|uniref:cold-regulated protein 27-like isoform X1 n=1 Tax=Primulina tabacum TaxID=48773 RepID=UPI003F5AC9A2
MERNLRSEELVLWNNADVSSLTVQNGGDVLRLLANVAAPDDCSAWTNEKHNLYLNNLEVSFVTQLHESRDLVNKNMTQKKPINSPEQFTASQHGCWRKIDHRGDELLSCPTADSHNCMKNSWIYFHHPSLSVDLQYDTEKHSSRKGIISHGLATCSQQVSAMNLYYANSFDSMKEGTGQNYVNHEDNDQPNLRSGVEKMKSA